MPRRGNKIGSHTRPQLRDAIKQRDAAEARIRELVLWSRRNDVTWESIAAELGVTKQAAAQRYGS